MKIKELSEKMVEALSIPHKPIHLTACNAYSKSDYLRFLKHKMSEDEILSFSRHIDICVYCAQGLKRASDKLKEDKNQQYFAQTMKLLDQLDIRNKIDIVLEAGKNILNIIQTTGQILNAPQPVFVRGEESEPPSGPMRCIVQNFDAPPTSVQICITPITENQKANLVLSLFDTKNELFISDANVYINISGIEQTLFTNAEGLVSFPVVLPGRYSIRIDKNGGTIADIDISASDQTP